MELVEQRDNLKRGREDSVSYVYLLKHLHYWKHIVPTHAFLQEEREAALEELKTAELHHKKLKVPLSFIEPFFWVGGGGVSYCSMQLRNPIMISGGTRCICR